MHFSHLHCHTKFSLLDGAADIGGMFKKAKADGHSAVAITDHGNMFGVFKFVAEAGKHGVKPIVGCEFYVVQDRHERKFTKEKKDVRYHQLMLAKNETGYRNLVKLCSLGFIEGMYGKYPRIDKTLIEQYHEGLIATTCCIGASVPKAILRKGEEEGEKEFLWWLNIFGEDFYVELQDHEIPDQKRVNEVLLKFARKHNVKVIVSNDSHYVDQQDANAHDILLCVNTGEKQSTPSAKDFSDDEAMPRGSRFAFYNDQFYFKTKNEMLQVWGHIPEGLDNTQEIVDKCFDPKLKKDILLPNFPIPNEFKVHADDTLNQWEYLRHLTFEGARQRYETISPEAEERLNFELHTIKTMGFAGYFLIVMDFIKAGRDIGVFVGPGRGSAAGSAVAYCIGITNIDPIKYNLLFERFLNPDRKSMPDIDTDFDDAGRQKVIDYVVEKYGRNQVAQIVSYTGMKAKSAIKDVGRVLDLPLDETNILTKLIPEKPLDLNLQRVLLAPIDGPGGVKDKEGWGGEEIQNIQKLRDTMKSNTVAGKVLTEALKLEGSVRGTGIHAAGIIIAPMDLTEIIPVCTSKDSDWFITQFEGKVIEDAGVIKMDFLGLSTLTILKNALALIRQNHGVEIDLDSLPLDDAKTYELFQRGETYAIFQYESAGMQKYMKELKPTRFEDLIAMNALYRPGPIQYIPEFIDRKHGRKPVVYDLPEMEEYLADTYGITVYQEQVMLLSQKLAGFSKGDADVLRKAMGKKDRATLDKMKGKFMEGAVAKGLDAKKLEKVWTDWEAFAQYAFNKSHSTCYAFVAYQTAYLKAHYPEEYMAANLTNELGDIKKITLFMEETRRMGLDVLGPDVNESIKEFNVNKKKQIRFGLGGIKGTGDAAVDSIIQERNANGPYQDIFDFVTRINLRTVNKKTLESLAYAGAFDSFGINRAAFFADTGTGTFIETLIRFANKHHEEKAAAQVSLFGAMSGGGGANMMAPRVPSAEPWARMIELNQERDVIGVYISGHPLDEFRIELDNFCDITLDRFRDSEEEKNWYNRDVRIAGIVTKYQERYAKNGNPFCLFTIEDYAGSMELALFGDDYVKMGQYVAQDRFLYIRGKLQPSWRNQGQYEFKATQIQLLPEVREKMCKQLSLEINLQEVSGELVASLSELFKQNPGTCNLFVKLKDSESPVEVVLQSRFNKINVSNDLIKGLEQLVGKNSFRLN
ncbi:DNA polymerase III subunit alpha [Siphonobacter sp.]|uniref:DNA polymerase III subunit alpha n=1 Tax=Siphonobacter sp. TaxID=1869184 RepID=UPI003B3B6178